MDKEKVLELISELEGDVQSMREDGETDLRTVLRYIRYAYDRINNSD